MLSGGGGRAAFDYWRVHAPDTYDQFLEYVEERETGGAVWGRWEFEHAYQAYRACFPERFWDSP